MQKSYYCRGKDGKEREFIVRTATQNDLIEILKLYNYILEDVYPEWFSSSEDMIANAVLNDDNEALIVLYNNKIVAFGDVFCEKGVRNKLKNILLDRDIDIPGGHYCMIDDIFVHQGYRGYHLQKALLRELCSCAADKGRDVALITVHPNNEYSEKNINDSGFIKANEEPLRVDGKTRDYWLKIVV